ncbi:uncharacterized protein (TIGR03086 family) [Herbihabitans rhizosphaerae]|uniref:Uncharacterized protein (TIGR03086 family) n=1 Tax=Herbihabitans rhizosphaerae TaxID=1872711 RepID=A0A4Q7KDD7_9PSEU|nr:TIGR03086 family metal-binding protein [Herbihabitans rhizosphaerae]RZS32215.1 uncharacterized protein (TIGR03086 family) [Herbihabitans rhizosphaerae]
MTTSTVDLLERAYAGTAKVLAIAPLGALAAPSPCDGWTVADVANHLVSALDVFARVAEGQEVDFDAEERDHLGDDPAGAFDTAAARCLAAFGRPGVLTTEFAFPFGPTPGLVIATISMQEALVHGWDIATGAEIGYEPDADVIAAVAEFNADSGAGMDGMFDPAVPVSAGASPFTALLAKLGRPAANS